MQVYQIVRAKTPVEALELSDWKIGDTVKCCAVGVSANSDGTYSIFPSFKKPIEETEEKKKEEFPKQLRSCLNRA